jgi:hypothetical protein
MRNIITDWNPEMRNSGTKEIKSKRTTVPGAKPLAPGGITKLDWPRYMLH